MIAVLQQAWNAIPMAETLRPSTSIPRRLGTCVAANDTHDTDTRLLTVSNVCAMERNYSAIAHSLVK